MVRIDPEGDNFVFTVEGSHKLWAFKSRLEIPRAHVRGAHRDPSVFHEPKGWRAPGTDIPWIFTAGTFFLHGDRVFWDVRHPARAIVVELHDEQYKELIIEVEDPDAAVALLTSKQ